MDTRVIPSENVSTDHRMVVATIRKETRRNRIGRTFQRRSGNVQKLMKPDINRKYQEEISYKLAQLPNKLNSDEKEWIDFKEIIQGTAENMVGQNKSGGQQKKATVWWKRIQHHRTNKSISQSEMHANKLSNMPKKRHCQSMVTNWRISHTTRSLQLKDMRKTEAMKSFYKKVKSMRERDQPYCPITTIKDA